MQHIQQLVCQEVHIFQLVQPIPQWRECKSPTCLICHSGRRSADSINCEEYAEALHNQ